MLNVGALQNTKTGLETNHHHCLPTFTSSHNTTQRCTLRHCAPELQPCVLSSALQLHATPSPAARSPPMLQAPTLIRRMFQRYVNLATSARLHFMGCDSARRDTVNHLLRRRMISHSRSSSPTRASRLTSSIHHHIPSTPPRRS